MRLLVGGFLPFRFVVDVFFMVKMAELSISLISISVHVTMKLRCIRKIPGVDALLHILIITCKLCQRFKILSKDCIFLI